MNKVEMFHLEKKEFWRNRIAQYAASGKPLQEWCKENGVSTGSMNRWRMIIWREEEAEKEIATNRKKQRKEIAEEAAEQVTIEENHTRKEEGTNSEDEQEEHVFVEISPEMTEGRNAVTIMMQENISSMRSKRATETQRIYNTRESRQISPPDAIVGYRDYVIGVYEHTSSQVLEKIVEVLRYA